MYKTIEMRNINIFILFYLVLFSPQLMETANGFSTSALEAVKRSSLTVQDSRCLLALNNSKHFVEKKSYFSRREQSFAEYRKREPCCLPRHSRPSTFPEQGYSKGICYEELFSFLYFWYASSISATTLGSSSVVTSPMLLDCSVTTFFSSLLMIFPDRVLGRRFTTCRKEKDTLESELGSWWKQPGNLAELS